MKTTILYSILITLLATAAQGQLITNATETTNGIIDPDNVWGHRETIIVTNTTSAPMVERYEAVECPDYVPGSPFHCAVYHCKPVYSKTDSIETEVVLERDQIRMTVAGREYTQTIGEKELSRKTRTVKQVQTPSVTTGEWQRVEQIGLFPAAWINLTYTNYFTIMGGDITRTVYVATNDNPVLLRKLEADEL